MCHSMKIEEAETGPDAWKPCIIRDPGVFMMQFRFQENEMCRFQQDETPSGEKAPGGRIHACDGHDGMAVWCNPYEYVWTAMIFFT